MYTYGIDVGGGKISGHSRQRKTRLLTVMAERGLGWDIVDVVQYNQERQVPQRSR